MMVLESERSLHEFWTSHLPLWILFVHFNLAKVLWLRFLDQSSLSPWHNRPLRRRTLLHLNL